MTQKHVHNMGKIIGVVVLVLGLMASIRVAQYAGLGLLIVAAVISQLDKRARRHN